MPDQDKSPTGIPLPDDLVPVGHISGAFGIQGWVRVQPYSSDADALLHAKTWWLGASDASGGLRDVEMLHSKPHGTEVVAMLMGIADRNAAEALRGVSVRIRRSHFPPPADNEFYWVDLIGLAVVNLQGEPLGVVGDLMDNGAHPILRVTAPQDEAAEKTGSRELLIPFVDRFVHTVDQTDKKITVDWERDY